MSKLKVTTHWDQRGDNLEPAVLKEETVTMVFPQRVILQLDDGGGFVEFAPGVNEVPRSLADHWYLKAHGVRTHTGQTERAASAMTEEHAAFIRASGHECEGAEAAQKLYDGLGWRQQAEFVEGFAAWKRARHVEATATEVEPETENIVEPEVEPEPETVPRKKKRG